MDLLGWAFHPYSRSTLLRATMNGVFRCFSNLNDSSVWASSPAVISTTRMAMLQREDPRLLKLVKDSCPGVSMISRPGTLYSSRLDSLSSAVFSLIISMGKYVAPICWVIPPASPSWTFVWRILSRSFVFPVSTCPRMQQMGERKLSLLSPTAVLALDFISSLGASAFALAAGLPAGTCSADFSGLGSSFGVVSCCSNSSSASSSHFSGMICFFSAKVFSSFDAASAAACS